MSLNAVPRQWYFIAINFLLFQVGWAIAVLWGSIPAAIYLVVGSALHFSQTHSAKFDLVSALLMVAIGVAHDSLLFGLGVIELNGSVLPPFWLVSVWFLLGLTLNHSLKAIYQSVPLSVLLGPVGGVFAYLAGVRLSDAQWGLWGQWGVLLVAAMWLFILPLHKALTGMCVNRQARRAQL